MSGFVNETLAREVNYWQKAVHREDQVRLQHHLLVTGVIAPRTTGGYSDTWAWVRMPRQPHSLGKVLLNWSLFELQIGV